MANTLNYVDYDILSLRNQLIQRLQARQGVWKDVYVSSNGSIIIDMYSYIANLVLYYIERRAEESYLPTAKLRSSILNLVRLLGYIPRRPVSATGKVTFSVVSPLSKKVFIPRWTVIQTSNAVQYVVSSDVVLLAGSLSVLADVKQGKRTEISVTSDGSADFVYNIDDTAIENTSLQVFVDGVEWSQAPDNSMLLSGSSDKVYKIQTEFDDTVSIQFGDGIRGMIPPASSTIFIRYIQTLGLSGNVYASTMINTIVSTLYDEDGAVVTGVSVTNGEALLGGDDEETAESIRTLAPKVFATGDRCVTREDYIAVLEDYPSVANANAWGENEVSPPNYDLFNTVRLAVILQEWQSPSNAFKTTLGTYLRTKAQLTVKYEFVSPTQILVIPVLDVKVIQGNTLSQVQSDIISAINAQFALGTTTRLGSNKYLSDLIAVVNAISGVSYHHLYFHIFKDLVHDYESPDQFGTTLDMLPVLSGSLEVYVGTELVAVDDGSNHLTSMNSLYTFTPTSGINYTSGHVGVSFVTPSPHPDAVSVRYKQNQSGDLIVGVNQICKLQQVDITSITYGS